jgi:hypothetical protein
MTEIKTFTRTKIVKEYIIPVAEFKNLIDFGENEEIKHIGFRDHMDSEQPPAIQIITESEL